jgi:hypothetical protein
MDEFDEESELDKSGHYDSADFMMQGHDINIEDKIYSLQDSIRRLENKIDIIEQKIEPSNVNFKGGKKTKRKKHNNKKNKTKRKKSLKKK